MRLLLLASAASLLGGAALAQSLLGQSTPGQNDAATPPAVIAVPPAPPVMAAPVAPVAPVAPAPAIAPPAPPPGLVQTPLPPPDSNADQGNTGQGNTDQGNANQGNAAGGDQTTQLQAVSPSAPVNGAPVGSGGAQPPAQDQPPQPANDWVPGKTAILGVLNKVDGSTSTLTIPVGGQATAGDLTVSVQACVSRPPGQLPDAAIFLTLQPNDAQSGPPVYRGWMVRSTPGATDAGNAGQAFRVITCS